jgi:hypothetical protein
MPGAWCARSRACSVVNTRVSHHGHTGNARHSPRNGFTTYFVLSPVIGLFCHRHQWISACWARRADIAISTNLTPASRRQDHTTSPSAFAPFVKGAIGVHRIPPHVRDDRETPLWEAGRANYDLIWSQARNGIFFA